MDARAWRSRVYSAKASIAARTIGTRTFFQLLDALERDLELERVQKRRGIVENGDVRQLNLGHGASDEGFLTRFLSAIGSRSRSNVRSGDDCDVSARQSAVHKRA